MKQLMVNNVPYTESPKDSSEMNAVVAVNFELTQQSLELNFPHQGNWYEYFSGQEYDFFGTTLNVSFAPGQYKLFTDVRIGGTVITGVEENLAEGIQLFPNPAENYIQIEHTGLIRAVSVCSMQGTKKVLSKITSTTWDISTLSAGLYVLEIETARGIVRTKIIKH
jgi:hypothetical protein